MVKTLFRTTQYEVSELLDELDSGVIVFSPGTPPFSWAKDDIKNLIHRMYKGLPIERVVLRQLTRREKEERPEFRFAQWVVYDGIDQLRALQSAFRSTPIQIDDDPEEVLQLAFNPRLELFDLPTTTNSEHPDWFSEIKQLWDSHYKSVDTFLRRNESAYKRQLFEETKWEWRDRFDKIRDLRDFPVSVLQLHPEVEIADYEWRLTPKPQKRAIPKPSDLKHALGALRPKPRPAKPQPEIFISEGAADEPDTRKETPESQPEDRDPQSETRDLQSGTPAPQPEDRDLQSETPEPQPEVRDGKPGAPAPQPEARDRKPGTRVLQPGTPASQPEAPTPTAEPAQTVPRESSTPKGVLRASFDWLRSMPGADELAEVTQKRSAKQKKEEAQDRTVDVQKAAWGQFYDRMVDFLEELEAESQRKHSRIAGYRVPEIDDLAMMAGLKSLGISSIYEIKKRIGASSDQRHDFASDQRMQAAKEFRRALNEVTTPSSWYHYIKVLDDSGYVTDRMHVEPRAMLYGYVLWLMARDEGRADMTTVDLTISRWFFMTQWTAMYGSGQSDSFENDLMIMLEEADLYPNGICGYLTRAVDSRTPRKSDFREMADQAKRPLETSSLTMPFLAALNIRNAELLMSPCGEKVAAKVVSNCDRIFELFTPIKVSAPRFVETYNTPLEGSLANHTLVSPIGYDKKTNQSLAEKWEEYKREGMSKNDKMQESFHALPQRVEQVSLHVFVKDRAERMVKDIFSAQNALRIKGNTVPQFRRYSRDDITRRHYGVSLLELIRHGYLFRGETLYLLNDLDTQATVNGDGSIRFEDTNYWYLSPAAGDAIGATRNGWQYWCVERGGKKIPMLDIRADYLEEREPRLP